ncbi:MAG: hypothetical protein HGA23_09335, partial [Bacteroidales bacterium]|nr:hypothetical protein [Bacteroidales bacterium]
MNVHVTENYIERCYRAIYLVNIDSVLIRNNVISSANDGVCVDDWCKDVEISGNRLVNITSHDNAPDGTSGVLIDNASEIDIFNNFIHTSGNGPVIGINLQNSTQCRVTFNSLNLTNIDSQGKSKGIMLKTSSAIQVLNNIFNVTNLGTPVYITAYAPQLVFDRNNYFSFDQTIGYYNGKRYNDLATWADSLNMDMNSLSVMPFYSSETDLSINQALLNNAGIPVTGITQDIDGTLRDPAHPDIGAKEYSLCQVDAGINAITSPGNILAGGPEEVKVVLQNQGSSVLTSAKINWLVNDDLQTPFVWSGNLAVGSNAEISLGNYNFQNGTTYVLEIWTSEPNSASDCNHKNDTIKSRELSGALCGTYTIGGANADFMTFTQAADVLNTAGITCPVTFSVRDGIYIEKIIIEDIKGSSEVNTITFMSESGDSTLAVIQIDPAAIKFESVIFLDGTQNIKFQGLGLSTGTGGGEANYAILMDAAKNIELSGCYFEVRNESDYCLVIQGGSQEVNVAHNRLECTDFRAGAINISGVQTRDINIDGNIINGSPTWGYTLVKIADNVKKLDIVPGNIDLF